MTHERDAALVASIIRAEVSSEEDRTRLLEAKARAVEARASSSRRGRAWKTADAIAEGAEMVIRWHHGDAVAARRAKALLPILEGLEATTK